MLGNTEEYFRSSSIVTPEIAAFIESCFEEDEREKIPKHKNNSKRNYNRLMNEIDFTGDEFTFRRTVMALKSYDVFILRTKIRHANRLGSH